MAHHFSCVCCVASIIRHQRITYEPRRHGCSPNFGRFGCITELVHHQTALCQVRPWPHDFAGLFRNHPFLGHVTMHSLGTVWQPLGQCYLVWCDGFYLRLFGDDIPAAIFILTPKTHARCHAGAHDFDHAIFNDCDGTRRCLRGRLAGRTFIFTSWLGRNRGFRGWLVATHAMDFATAQSPFLKLLLKGLGRGCGRGR